MGDLSDAASLVSIGDVAFGDTFFFGGPFFSLVIPAKVKTIGDSAFTKSNLTGVDLSNAASLVSIGAYAFSETKIKGTIKTPFDVPAYKPNSFPSGVTIVKG